MASKATLTCFACNFVTEGYMPGAPMKCGKCGSEAVELKVTEGAAIKAPISGDIVRHNRVPAPGGSH